MQHFNKAFYQTHLATGTAGYDPTAGGVPSVDLLGSLGKGAVTFLYADGSDAYKTVGAVPANERYILASTSWFEKDKQGIFHGGYHATNKSKIINPKLIHSFRRVDPQVPVNHIVQMDSVDDCVVCDTTYLLRLDLKGSPVYRFLNREAYGTYHGTTSCCPDNVPETNVDPAEVTSQWAESINEDPILGNNKVHTGSTTATDSRFENSLVRAYFISGTTLYIPDELSNDSAAILAEMQAAGVQTSAGALASVDVFSNFTPVAAPGPFEPSSLVLVGAYVETKFGDCSFKVSDNYNVEPVLIDASQQDEEGDRCKNACFVKNEIQQALQVMGTGEALSREFLLDQSYRQNYMEICDPREREIREYFELIGALDRSALYTTYYIEHTVPRKDNPTGVLDNDHYIVMVVTDATDAAFETFIADWLTAAGNDTVTLEVY